MKMYLSPVAFAWLVLTVFQVNDASAEMSKGCVTAGSWTQQVLTQTNEILSAISQLRNDPKCQKLAAILAPQKKAVEATEESIGVGPRIGLTNLGNEIKAMGKMADDSAIQGDVAGIRDVLGDQLGSSGVGPNLSSNLLQSKLWGTINTGLSAITGFQIDQVQLQQRAKMVGESAYGELANMINQLDDLSESKGCFASNVPVGGRMIGGIINMAGALAGSHSVSNGRISDLLNALTLKLRNARFNWMESQLGDNNILKTLLCVVETTAFNYCSINEAQALRDWAVKQAWKDEKTSRNGALRGYYSFFRDARVVADWQVKVLSGIEPRFYTDATFKNNTLRSYFAYLMTSNDLFAVYNEHRMNVDRVTENKNLSPSEILNTQRLYVMKMIGEITEKIIRAEGDPNFFTSIRRPIEIPFYLIGLAVPKVVSNADGMSIPVSWDNYMQYNNGGAWITAFENPVALADSVRLKLRALIESANVEASQHYRKRLIPDTQRLIMDSAISNGAVTGSVVKALQNIHAYMSTVKKEIEARSKNGTVLLSVEDATALTTIEDTMYRVGVVLREFNFYQTAVRDVKTIETRIKALRDQISANSAASAEVKKPLFDELAAQELAVGVAKDKIKSQPIKILDTVLIIFDMLIQRDGFLPERVRSVANFEFAERIKSGKTLSQYQRELLTISGTIALDSFSSILTSNPTEAKYDLALAKTMAANNLTTVEELAKDRLMSTIRELWIRSRMGRPLTNFEYDLLTTGAAFREAYNLQPRPGFTVAQTPKTILKETVQNLFSLKTYTGPLVVTVNTIDYLLRVFHLDMGGGYSWDERYRYKSDGILGIPNPWSASGKQKLPSASKSSDKDTLALLCAHALTFENPEPFYLFCAEAKLTADLNPNDPTRKRRYDIYYKKLIKERGYNHEQAKRWAQKSVERDYDYYNLSFHEALKKSFRRSGWLDSEKYYYEQNADRVCAYRNFLRRSNVYYMLHAVR